MFYDHETFKRDVCLMFQKHPIRIMYTLDTVYWLSVVFFFIDLDFIIILSFFLNLRFTGVDLITQVVVLWTAPFNYILINYINFIVSNRNDICIIQ